MTPVSRLHLLTNQILNADINAYGQLFAVADDLYKFLLEITVTDTEENENREKMYLDSGHAIGLTWAAMCIKDIMRTKKFMEGIYKATLAGVKKTDGPIHILYAGTGPFATLILPLIERFSSKQVQFTLLEVNEYSFRCLQRLVTVLQLEPYIRQMEKADATLWKIDQEIPVDIFISETMNTGLTKEPQVSIFMNILPQLKDNAIIIPETIRLQAALIDPAKRMQHKINNTEAGDSVCPLDLVFELSKRTVLQHATAFKEAKGNYKFTRQNIMISPEKATTHPQFSILTTITVYSPIQLLADESPLTMPLKLTEFKDFIPREIECYYETSTDPGVRFTETLRLL